METEGRCFANNKKRKKNREKLPKRIPSSMAEGAYRPQAWGIKSWATLPIIITKRSYHMPTFTKMEMPKSHGILLRILLKKKSRGIKLLQMIMIQNCTL